MTGLGSGKSTRDWHRAGIPPPRRAAIQWRNARLAGEPLVLVQCCTAVAEQVFSSGTLTELEQLFHMFFRSGESQVRGLDSTKKMVDIGSNPT